MADLVYNGQSTKGADNTWLPPHAYIAHKLNDDWAIGLGVYSRFGLGTEYEKARWPGAANIYYAAIETVSFAPVLSYRLTDTISIGGGIEFVHVGLDMRKHVGSPAGPDGRLDASGDGVGFNFGVHWKPNDQWRVGLSYKSQVEIGASGTQKFNPAIPGVLPAKTGVSGTVVLPDMIAAGVTYYPMPNLSIEVGAMLTRWSTYNEFALEFDDPVAFSTEKVDEKNWDDVMRYSVGVEYGITDWLDLRAGYVFDESPLDPKYADYIVPGNDRHLFNLGAGFKWNSWTADVSYTYLWMKGRSYADSVADGVVQNSYSKDSYAHIYGLTIGYTF
jgi:long-chain fatty acid transport protein